MKKLAKFSAFAAAAFVTFFTGNALAGDWFWNGPTGDVGGKTSVSEYWSINGDSGLGAMVFSKDAFDKTIVFDQFYNVGSDVFFGIHGGTASWESTDEYSFVLKATSSEMGVVAPGKLSVAGWGGAPICRVRIEGGTYTFGDASNCGWGNVGVMVGEGNWGYLDLVSGTITCLNNFWLSCNNQPNNGVVTVGGGDDLAVISVTNKAVTKLRGGDGNSGYGSLTLKANGVFKTNYIVWDNDLATMTFDGGTLVKNGDLSMGQETAGKYGSGREGLICGDGSYNNGTTRTINITSNGGTIQCDYPVLIESAFALTNDATSAVLTKTGSEKFTWRGNRPGVGLNVQAGTANILASQPLASLAIASGGTLEVDCTGCSGDSLTIVPASGTVTLPSGVSASSVVTPVGDGASDYTASYSDEAGLQLLKGVQPTHTHVWGEWTTNTVATETVAGERQHTCTAEGCDVPPAVVKEAIPATGHIWGEWVTTLEPTYTAAGSRERHCSAIDCVLGGTETEEIPMLTHTHEWGEWVVYKSATATEAGERRRYCTAEGCSDPVAYQSEEIPATGGGDDPIVDPPTTGKEYHWRGAAPGTSFAAGDAGSPTHACGQWATVSNWTDANGNTMTDYPHQNGDVAIFHGTVNGGFVQILAENVIDISEIRFVEGHTILAVDANAHFSATRMTFMNHATFGYVGTDFSAFTPPNDFVIGNRDDLLVKDGSGNYGLLLGGACYQNWSSGNFANNNTVSLDADGKLVTHVGTENMSIDLWGNDTYSDLGGVIFGQWEDFRGINYNNDATWTYTVKASSFMHINNYGHIGKAADKAQGTVNTTGTDCYVWSRAQPAERCTVYVRSKIVNAPTLVVAGFGYTVLFDNHESETCDYCITTGDLRLGGDICKGSTSTIESWTCKLGSGDISVGWSGKLDVACANPFDAATVINVSSYNKKGGIFGKINLANNGVVKKLQLDGLDLDAGTYGATGSGATNIRDDIFTGSGVLTVTNGTYVPPDDPPVTEKEPMIIYFN